jgi:kinetochore protein Spc7/SPC105
LFLLEADLRAAAADLANCDQDELRDARQRLVATDEEIKAKRQMIEQLRAQVYEKETRLEVARERKQVCLDDIRAAEKIREECRGWTGKEIMSLKGMTTASTKRSH